MKHTKKLTLAIIAIVGLTIIVLFILNYAVEHISTVNEGPGVIERRGRPSLETIDDSLNDRDLGSMPQPTLDSGPINNDLDVQPRRQRPSAPDDAEQDGPQRRIHRGSNDAEMRRRPPPPRPDPRRNDETTDDRAPAYGYPPQPQNSYPPQSDYPPQNSYPMPPQDLTPEEQQMLRDELERRREMYFDSEGAPEELFPPPFMPPDGTFEDGPPPYYPEPGYEYDYYDYYPDMEGDNQPMDDMDEQLQRLAASYDYGHQADQGDDLYDAAFDGDHMFDFLGN